MRILRRFEERKFDILERERALGPHFAVASGYEMGMD
jgi:hypothetical protein